MLRTNYFQLKYCFAGRLHCTDWLPECPASGLCAGPGHDSEGNFCLLLLPSASASCRCLDFLPPAVAFHFLLFPITCGIMEVKSRLTTNMFLQSQNSLLSTHLHIICHAGVWKVHPHVAKHHQWHTMCALVLCHNRLIHLFNTLHCGGLCHLPCLCQSVRCHTWQALDSPYSTSRTCDWMPH